MKFTTSPLLTDYFALPYRLALGFGGWTPEESASSFVPVWTEADKATQARRFVDDGHPLRLCRKGIRVPTALTAAGFDCAADVQKAAKKFRPKFFTP